jgi:hypothetical protein
VYIHDTFTDVRQKQERGHYVPTLSAIIKAGDEAIYSSMLFSALQGHPGPLPLETLHDAFTNELRARATSERSAYPSAISSYLSITKKPLQRSQSVKIKARDGSGRGSGRPELPPRTQRTSIDLAEMGLGRAVSRRVAPVLVLMGNGLAGSVKHEGWANDLQHALYFEGRPGITVKKSELAALSLILGCPLKPFAAQDDQKDKNGEQTASKGAYGISISGAAADDETYHISLTQHKRSISQLPARGSGYSSLFAKFVPCGSLPFAMDSTKVDAILITHETLEALKAGTALNLQPTISQTPASTLLASLPHSRPPTFHTLVPSTTSNPQTLDTLLTAIAALPFNGGLTPLASTPLIQTVQFIASGGLVPGRLLQRLDALVEKVHRYSPHLHLFGPLLEDKNAGLLFRERKKLGKLATAGMNSEDEPLADKAARMHRYVTLIERLMSLVPNRKPHVVLAAVKEEVKKQIEQAYHDAVAIATDPNPKPRSSLSRHSTRRSKRSSSSSVPSSPVQASRASVAFSRCSATFPPQNLGSCVEDVLKMELPLDVATVSVVVRMVIVAWTVSVGVVEGLESDLGAEKMVLW